MNMLSCCFKSKINKYSPSNNELDISLHCCISSNDTKYLDNITYNDTISYIHNIKYGKVIKICDLNTIIIATKLSNESPIYRFSVKLSGIDFNDLQKEAAIKALTEAILNKIVFLKNIYYDNFECINANIYCNNININSWLLTQGYLELLFN